ncbi:hypothetical protein [Telluria aromaticivorans]|uniref:Uncharacterized protein n=1 Tax=Telluria aromaticivorans TaxID=2725995 RepID=A0A7Y2JXG2_9BURK|nr:hypothetical protein [Telluria aromaticivorans]NNG22188.1 hypothetical protein [Telluria aromaticivorans]
MISRRKLNHFSAGLLDTFITRYNDYEGYWAFGVLYREVQASANRMQLDLLAATAQPEAPAACSVARTYARYLHQAIAKLGVRLEELESASMVIEFGLPPVPRNPNLVQVGDPFTCTLHVVTRDGRRATRQKLAQCMRVDEFRGSRSTRYTG